uniref:Uncharacterized protein n=1 Tax=Megaselia scalaris TaxID=36166 RepID=T1H1D8_MEGSC
MSGKSTTDQLFTFRIPEDSAKRAAEIDTMNMITNKSRQILNYKDDIDVVGRTTSSVSSKGIWHLLPISEVFIQTRNLGPGANVRNNCLMPQSYA